MTTDAWVELDADGSDRAWAAFDEVFGTLQPGMDPGTWPAVREPTPSITLDFSPIFGVSEARAKAGVGAINSLGLYAFTQLLTAGGCMYFLDWQHPAYRFSPHNLTASYSKWDPPAYPHGDYPPLFPDGDYYSFLTEDLSCGTFGHPWAQTLCVFGEPLIQLLGEPLASWLPACRRNGQIVVRS